MKIFLSGTSFHPSYGGPAVSVSRLAVALCEAGLEVGLWAPDSSAMDSPVILKHPSLSLLDGDAATALDQFGKPDLIHDNGMWLRHNHHLAKLATALRTPRIVSTRGMLEPWALNHKKWKKRLAWWLYQRHDLRITSLLHATSESEAANLRALGFRNRIVVIPNGIELPEYPPLAVGEVGDCKTALFVGRIYPVKGLPLLIEAWAKVRPARWMMRIVGPDEAGHLAEVKDLVRKAGLDDVFEFAGSMEGEALQRAYQDADLFILPSHTENFGMVIGEAMSHGLPVITTHGAPWELLEQENCGWWVPVSVDGLAAALDDATKRSGEELQAMGERGRQIVEERFAWDRIAGEFINCYDWVIKGGERPGCVREE